MLVEAESNCGMIARVYVYNSHTPPPILAKGDRTSCMARVLEAGGDGICKSLQVDDNFDPT